MCGMHRPLATVCRRNRRRGGALLLRLRRIAAQQPAEDAEHVVVRWHLSVGRDVIDELRQKLGDRARGGRERDPVLLSELLDELIAEHLFYFLSGDGEILAITHPGLDDVPKTGAFELLDEPAQALARAVVRDERIGEGGKHLRFVAASEDGTNDRFE